MREPPFSTPVRCAASGAYLWLKGAADRTVAFVLLIVLLVPLVVLALLIRCTSSGPALFRQTRAGRLGQPFTLWKFRTMRTNVDPYGGSPQHGTDPRLTRVGRWLREYSLDELPQLVNVLCGDMSIVGPRPLYLQQMAEWNERQRGRLLVKPGLTGLAQMRGRASLTIEDKLEWDVRYVETISFSTDVRIIFETISALFRRGGIYEVRYSRERERRGENIASPPSPSNRHPDDDETGPPPA
jgi:lipopolysaccharide/colanic/teichoic acid biosynthesis glycosyltransferase